MLGHECRLHWTNAGGCTWICQCGELGNIVPMAARLAKEQGRTARRVALTESRAQAAHGRHLDDVRADIARRSDDELARIGKLIPLANETLQRRGRWGHA